jgi:P27 family predicted phage terminase small subunit
MTQGRRVPTELKKARGNPGKRPLPEDEPKLAPAKGMKPPSFLSKNAQKHWPTIAKHLEEARILTVIDGAALAYYCEQFLKYIAARDVIAAQGLTMWTPTGFLVERPENAAMDKAHDRMLKILIEYGCTPASRTRVRVAKSAEDKGNRFAKIAETGDDDD